MYVLLSPDFTVHSFVTVNRAMNESHVVKLWRSREYIGRDNCKPSWQHKALYPQLYLLSPPTLVQVALYLWKVSYSLEFADDLWKMKLLSLIINLQPRWSQTFSQRTIQSRTVDGVRIRTINLPVSWMCKHCWEILRSQECPEILQGGHQALELLYNGHHKYKPAQQSFGLWSKCPFYQSR